MKLFIALAIIVALPCWGVVQSARHNAAGQNIPTSYSTGAGSRIFTNTRLVDIEGALIDNDTDAEVAVVCSSSATVVPNDNSNQNMYVGSGKTLAVDFASLGGNIKYCYARGVASAATTGILRLLFKGLR